MFFKYRKYSCFVEFSLDSEICYFYTFSIDKLYFFQEEPFKNIFKDFCFCLFVILFLLFLNSGGQRLPSGGQTLDGQQNPGLSNQKVLCNGTGNKNRGTLGRKQARALAKEWCHMRGVKLRKPRVRWTRAKKKKMMAGDYYEDRAERGAMECWDGFRGDGHFLLRSTCRKLAKSQS